MPPPLADFLGPQGNRRSQQKAQDPGAEGARAPHRSGHDIPELHPESRPMPLHSWAWLAPRPCSPVSNTVRPRGRASVDGASAPSSK